MKVLFVGTLPPHPGGSATSNALCLAGLGRAGHEVHALAPITEATRSGGEAFANANPGVSVHRYEVGEYLIDPYGRWPDGYRCRERKGVAGLLPEMIERLRPDIFVAGRENYAWLVPKIASGYGIPGVAIAHGTLKCWAGEGVGLAEPDDSLEELKRADATLVASSHMHDIARGLGLPRVFLVRNSIDLDQFSPAPKDPGLLAALELSREHVIVLHASNFKPLKRVGDIVSAAASALELNPALRFLVVGDGPVREALQARCGKEGVARYFRFTGWIDSARMPRYVNLADMVAMTSQTENQPMIVLESQGCAKAVVATDIPGHRELITDGENGRLFTVGDHGSLAAIIVDLAANPHKRAAMGRRARRFVSRHDVTRVAQCYGRIFDEIRERRAAC